MRKLEKINQSIHEGVISNYYSRMIDCYTVKEFTSQEKEFYEIKFYVKFIVSEEFGLSEYRYDIEKIVEAIEDNVLIKLDREFCFITYIEKVNRFDDSVEIVAIAESV